MALWTPANAVVKPEIWLDASDSSTLTLNGSGVLNWADKGSNALDAYQTNASLQPQLIENALNGKPVVSFNGSRYLQFAQTRSLINKTFIILFDWTEGGISNFLGDAAQRFQLFSRMNFFSTGYPASNPTSQLALGAGWNIAQADHHATLNYFANGILDPVTQTRSYTATANFTNFARSTNTNWTGRIAAFLMLPAPPDEAERQQYEGWLAHNWGVANLLIPSHPYYNAPPVTELVVPVSIPNAPDGARYRIWNQTRSAEIENAIVSGGAGISTTFIADDDTVPHVEGDSIVVDLTYPVSTTAYLPSRVLGQASGSGVSGFVSQADDEIYNFHGIDGSTLTIFDADFVDDEIDIIVSQNFLGASLYAFYVHSLTFEEGIRSWLGAMTAIDNANFRVNTSVMSIKLDNDTTNNVWQTDNVRVFRSDGARPVKHPTTGGGGIDVNWRSQVYTTIISTASPVITGDISDVPTATEIANAVWNKTLP